MVLSYHLNADPQKFTQSVDDLTDFRDSVTRLCTLLSWHRVLDHTHTHNTWYYTRNSAPSTSLYKLPTYIKLVSSLSSQWNIFFVQSNLCLYIQMFLKDTTTSLLQKQYTFLNCFLSK